MKKIFTLIAAVACFSAVHAQQLSTAAPAKPVVVSTDAGSIAQADNLLVLKETEYDFGKIPQGKPVTHIFEVFNKSNAELKISNVHASCGCTTPEWEKDKSRL